MAGNSSWRSPGIHFSGTGATVFNNNSPSSWTVDNIHSAETIARTIAKADVYIIQESTLPTKVDTSGWWEDTLIALGMYIPGLPGNAGVTPGPLTGSADDQWLWRFELVCDRVTIKDTQDLVIAHYSIPGVKVDTQSRQGPCPAFTSFPVQVAWEWFVPFGYEQVSGPSFSSFMGMRFWQQSLYLHG